MYIMKTSKILVQRAQQCSLYNSITNISSISPTFSCQIKSTPNLVCKNIQRRFIFTEEFLGVNIARLKQEQVKKEIAVEKINSDELQNQILNLIPNHLSHNSPQSGISYSYFYFSLIPKLCFRKKHLLEFYFLSIS